MQTDNRGEANSYKQKTELKQTYKKRKPR